MDKFNKHLLISKWWLLGLSISVFFLPMLLTCKPISFLNFTDTGQIGDTIGGIMSPFIAILVGYLTFEAFRMQYIANEMQKEEQEKQKEEIEQGKLRNARDRFDQRFYILLNMLRSNSRSINIGNGYSGKSAFKMMVAEFFSTFYVVKKAYLTYKPLAEEEIRSYIDALGDTEEQMLTRIASGLFFLWRYVSC